jgi:hypothetical protein
MQKQTKEMLMGPVLSNLPPQIVVNENTVARVTSFKLLGVIIANNINWDKHLTKYIRKSQLMSTLFETVKTFNSYC